MKTIIVKWHGGVNDSRFTLHRTKRVEDSILAIDALGDPSGTEYRFVPKADVPNVEFDWEGEYYDNKKDEHMMETLWDGLTSKIHRA